MPSDVIEHAARAREEPLPSAERRSTAASVSAVRAQGFKRRYGRVAMNSAQATRPPAQTSDTPLIGCKEVR